MNFILLSGGSGKRLWPLSNGVRAKQFLKVLKNEDGENESMVQRTYRKIKSIAPNSKIIIATGKAQAASIYNQLNSKISLSVEPSRRDTFPAIVLATANLHEKMGVRGEEPIIVCPIDTLTEDDYYFKLRDVLSYVENEESRLVLMGIRPSYPTGKYGYIIPQDSNSFSKVEEFREKPSEDTAKQLLKRGALWNSGIVGFKCCMLLERVRYRYGLASYDEILEKYNDLPSISFDYEVIEKETSIGVVRYDGVWKDIGTWNTLAEAMEEAVAGNVTAINCSNTHIINELQIPLLSLGIHNAVIASTPDGILISDKTQSSNIKKYVKSNRPMCEKREWGEYKVLEYVNQVNGINSLTKRITVCEGKRISYQMHLDRLEIWVVTNGEGDVVLDGKIRHVKRGDTVVIKKGIKHGIKALSELHIIEVQIGDELTDDDIEQLETDW